ncbi:MAG: phosphoglycerate kinase [Solirubrobacterales bacterium]|nr:phosphoglycerate kinase [Solirubrobacterales bacterium]
MPTIDDLDVEGRRVLLRSDFNVPLKSASAGASVTVGDDTRIRDALPTIEELLRRGARLVLISHLDEPARRAPSCSMRPVAERLARLTGARVPLAPGVTGPEVRELTERLAPGAMLMLENLRFAAGETVNEQRLASALAELADLYVDNALASADGAHPSTEGVAHLLPCAAGRLMEREILALRAVVDRPARPLVAILGGARVGDNIGLVRRFLELADVLCIGGAMCLPFLSVLRRVGQSLYSAEDLGSARLALAATPRSGRLMLPSDLLLWSAGEQTGNESRAADRLDVTDDQVGLDIGPETADRYAAEINRAATVFWSGPMGRIELPSFAGGTRAIAEAVASTSATTVVGGVSTVHALRAYGLKDRVSHLSTGGGAALKLLEGRKLPGLEALRGVRIIQSA